MVKIKAKGNVIYLPVFHDFKGHNWWGGKFFNYPYVLISPVHYFGNSNLREDSKMKDAFVVSDSGGYQKAMGKFDQKINVVDILRWQENNADVGFILDVPPLKLKGRYGGSLELGGNKVFDKSLDETFKNAKMAVEYKEKKDFELYGVVQGNSFDQLRKWHTKMSELDFPGWAFAPKFVKENPIMAVDCLCYAMENIPDKPIHFFGFSFFEIVAVLVYASKWLKKITFDSGTFLKGAIGRKYAVPFHPTFNLNFGMYKSETTGKKPPIYSELPCDCPVCSNTDIKIIYDYDSPSLGGIIISLHNLFWFVQQVNFLNVVRKENEEEFRKYVRQMYGGVVEKAIDFIDVFREKGYQSASAKYAKYLSRIPDGREQQTIFKY